MGKYNNKLDVSKLIIYGVIIAIIVFAVFFNMKHGVIVRYY